MTSLTTCDILHYCMISLYYRIWKALQIAVEVLDELSLKTSLENIWTTSPSHSEGQSDPSQL